MEIRRGLMMGMVGNCKQEILTITDPSLNNSSNIDAYFGVLIDGWETEHIILALKNPTSDANHLIACWSKYSLDVLNMPQVYRINNGKATSITRNDWAIKIDVGDEFIITRLGTFQQ